MTGMFGDPAKHVSNPLFRLWKYIEDRQSNPPNTEECAAYMGLSLTQARYLLTQRLRLYVSGRWNWHGRDSRKRGMDYNTWVGNTWTTAMINNPFPAPRGWKPKDEADD